MYYDHDEENFFPEEVAVSSSGEPFDDACDEIYPTLKEAIEEWCEKIGIEQGSRTDEEMMDFINDYEYYNDDTYFYIRQFTFESLTSGGMPSHVDGIPSSPTRRVHLPFCAAGLFFFYRHVIVSMYKKVRRLMGRT